MRIEWFTCQENINNGIIRVWLSLRYRTSWQDKIKFWDSWNFYKEKKILKKRQEIIELSRKTLLKWFLIRAQIYWKDLILSTNRLNVLSRNIGMIWKRLLTKKSMKIIDWKPYWNEEGLDSWEVSSFCYLLKWNLNKERIA